MVSTTHSILRRIGFCIMDLAQRPTEGRVFTISTDRADVVNSSI